MKLYNVVVNMTKKESITFVIDSSVIQLGLEPRTPSLKGMCSTC